MSLQLISKAPEVTLDVQYIDCFDSYKEHFYTILSHVKNSPLCYINMATGEIHSMFTGIYGFIVTAKYLLTWSVMNQVTIYKQTGMFLNELSLII
jgi:hypothetical protein